METIASFTVDHLRLLPGIYVSRQDIVGGETVTTFDIRMTRPNYEPVMNTAEVHHRAPWCYFPAQPRKIRRKDPVLWPDGLPHRILSSAHRKLQLGGYRSTPKGNVFFYRFLHGGCAGGIACLLRQLS